jgi:isopenicillin N synthase-like dioxygenase
MKRNIPTVDLSTFVDGNAESRAAFIAELGEAFSSVGFVSVVNHGVSPALIEDFYEASKAFFALPVETKRKYEVKGLAGQRGYTSFGKEHAKHTDIADLKEFFQIGQENEIPNAHVAEQPDFLNLGVQLFETFEATGAALLRAIALYLHLPENYFDERIANGNSVLRAIHYPPITQEPESAIRAEQHEDINLITLLVGASAGGLQLLTKQDEWLDVMPKDNEIVVNVGDMLQRLTNNYLCSTTHRVINPPREMWHLPRLSIPFFLHPRGEMDLTCLENCVTTERPRAYEPITAGDYLDERLREIGLKK